MTRLITMLCLASISLGCRGQVSEEPPVVPIRNMYDQPRYDAQERSAFFADERTMRPPVPGTVAVEMESNSSIATGRTEDNGSWLPEIPSEVIARFDATRGTRTTATGRVEHVTWGALNAEQQTAARRHMLERGHERYDVYCAPCHSYAGDGRGMIARRAGDLGFSAIVPPSFHEDKYRHMPDGQVYATITNGVRNMPAYSQSIPLDDRWAIVAYLRALQVANPNTGEAAQ